MEIIWGRSFCSFRTTAGIFLGFRALIKGEGGMEERESDRERRERRRRRRIKKERGRGTRKGRREMGRRPGEQRREERKGHSLLCQRM